MKECWCLGYHLPQVICECCLSNHRERILKYADYLDAVIDENEAPAIAGPFRHDGPARCICCGSVECPGVDGGIDVCPHYRAAAERNRRDEYYRTVPLGHFVIYGRFAQRTEMDEANMTDENPERWENDSSY